MTTHTYLYELRLDPGAPPEVGEIVANSEQDARRQLRVRYLCARLPRNTRIVDREAADRREAEQRSATLRHLLRVLAAHHRWLNGEAGGERADLSGLDLAGVDLRGVDLTDGDLSHADLSGARLAGATLERANLSASVLVGADLRGARLVGVDLSDADLRDSDFAEAVLDGADLWRANLRGCAIEPQVLHAVLGCVPPSPSA
jgi:uncharacterized protein YjbI with pentapeptide repeats